MTTECPKCRHKFLRYASNCPECGWARPRVKKFNKTMAMSLVISATALVLTIVIGNKIKEQQEAPMRKTETANARR